MELEEQVVYKGLSKKIEQLGVKQDSVWYWCCIYGRKWKKSVEWELRNDKGAGIRKQFKDSVYSAFTVSELGELLPKCITIKENEKCYVNYHIVYRELMIEKYVGYETWKALFPKKENRYTIIADTEANARAKMLIHLIEQGDFNPREKKK